MSSSAIPFIQKQLKELLASPPGGFRVEPSENSIYTWIVWFAGPSDTPYFGGTYKAQVKFPKEFPMEPPEFRVLSDFWHPNVYNKGEDTGKVCISILHPPGVDDQNSLETAMMRWTPVQTMRSVFISILSLLSEPDPKDAGAPANVDALVMYRSQREAFNKKCKELAEKSVQQLPEGFEPIRLTEEVEKSSYANNNNNNDDDDDDDFLSKLSPQPVMKGKERYRDELMQIRSAEMGANFSDDEILDMLLETRGDVSEVLGRLM